MPRPRHLRSAPINEAIIDIRVKARPDFQALEFSSLQTDLTPRFPKVEQRRGGQVTFQLSGTGAATSSIRDLGLVGYFFKSNDEKLIAQFRVDGFTLNRLRPYTAWEELLPTAMELWQLYLRVARPEAMTRLALRYINRIPLPPDLTTLADYLREPPRVPEELPQYVSAFFSRVTIHYPDTDLAAHIVQALERDDPAKDFAVLLDIDGFRDVDISPDSREVEETFRQLRDFKNAIFFSYLTERALERFT